ncbi:hypothetical protein [Carboxylicivirga marina]|uniref:DUF2178 domain-containing protein n=1 Tax=Carboxylicivirga marina TaxID=2800988 RepID=A0ABS1HP19_9BACT|nr:hypothetical protein [Carboxylicivirga marina]MBK3519441.1 hypothetical protein [Carboxylicivirga marina]
MKTKRALLIVVGLTLAFSAGIVAYSQMAVIPTKMLIIYCLILISALASIFIAIKKVKEEKEGQPLEDELSSRIKHKAGYLAYVASLYMWLFIFLFRGFFPDVETMVGGGVLLSGLIGYICKFIVKKQFNEESN